MPPQPHSDHPSITIEARAKINLHLAVLAREDSGYHSVETILQKIDLSDTVTVSLLNSGPSTLACDVDFGNTEDNLAFKAAKLFLAHARWNTGFHINLIKRIPAGAGLGGSSADAAATLSALNTLAEQHAPEKVLPHSKILELASSLGADVPFMASPFSTAIAWGRGDRMLELAPLPARQVVLVVPKVRVSTREAYGWVDTSRKKAGSMTLNAGKLSGSWHKIAEWAYNDFQPVVSARLPDVQDALEEFTRSGAEMTRMSGTGSVVFGIFDAVPAGLEERLCSMNFDVIVTATATG